MSDSNKNIASFDEIKSEIKKATKAAVKELFVIDEDFYYLVLAMPADARFAPYLCACSTEGLTQTVKKYIEEYGYDPNEPGLEDSLRWSSADSPYAYFGNEKYFKDLQDLYIRRWTAVEDDNPDTWEREWLLHSKAIILALKELDNENVFERKNKRKHLLINVAPDHLNVKSTAYILNDKELFEKAIDDNILEDDAEWIMDEHGNLHIKD